MKVSEPIYRQPSVLCVVPVRGGSKRIPKKNLVPILGKPLLQWTLEQVLQLPPNVFPVISSEDPELLGFANAYSIYTVERPIHLAQATSTTESALAHALSVLGGNWDWIMLLQATSPFRRIEHIADILRYLAIHSDVDSIVSAVAKHELGTIRGTFEKTTAETNSLSFAPNGAIYCVRRELFLTNESLYGNKHVWYTMQEAESLDVDTWDDVNRAEHLARTLFR
jgi:CMP-N-acetylneuraminic acid synthetase